MDYLLSFLEGMITFISPCLLPMIPVYVSFFAGQQNGSENRRVLLNAFGFVFGFTIFFVTLGVFAGTIGRLLKEFSVAVNLITGLIVILFGLHFMGIIKIPFFYGNRQFRPDVSHTGFFSFLLFGIVFSIGWTPCVGVFLGSALMLAANRGESVKGIFMLLSYSLGLGIPFLISAVLIDRLKTSFVFIKRHYRAISLISGGFLVAIGLLMATGFIGYFLSILTF